MKKLFLLCGAPALAGALLFAAACGDGEEGGDGAPSSAAPAVDITAPADGATGPAGDVTVTVEASNFEVVDRLNADPAPGEGHVHFYMDVDQIPTTPGQPAVSAQGTYHASATTSYTWTDVAPGEHTFAVQLVNNNHTPLDPPAVAEVTVTVE